MNSVLIAPAGWDERYLFGVQADIEQFQPKKILIPYSIQYAERTTNYRQTIQSLAKENNIEYIEFKIDYQSSIELYQTILNICSSHCMNATVRLQASTTPRDIIWYFLHILQALATDTQFSYYQPKEYTGDYLSRDAHKPSLVLMLSGIAYPDRKTCILVLSGYDEERLFQLKNGFEPDKIIIAKQKGIQFDNNHRNTSIHNGGSNIEEFEFDGYNLDRANVEYLLSKIEVYTNTHNVIAASLGPKPSAVILFELTKIRPEIGLVYAPAGDYSFKYSSGINLDNHILVSLNKISDSV